MSETEATSRDCAGASCFGSVGSILWSYGKRSLHSQARVEMLQILCNRSLADPFKFQNVSEEFQSYIVKNEEIVIGTHCSISGWQPDEILGGFERRARKDLC